MGKVKQMTLHRMINQLTVIVDQLLKINQYTWPGLSHKKRSRRVSSLERPRIILSLGAPAGFRIKRVKREERQCHVDKEPEYVIPFSGVKLKLPQRDGEPSAKRCGWSSPEISSHADNVQREAFALKRSHRSSEGDNVKRRLFPLWEPEYVTPVSGLKLKLKLGERDGELSAKKRSSSPEISSHADKVQREHLPFKRSHHTFYGDDAQREQLSLKEPECVTPVSGLKRKLRERDGELSAKRCGPSSPEISSHADNLQRKLLGATDTASSSGLEMEIDVTRPSPLLSTADDHGTVGTGDSGGFTVIVDTGVVAQRHRSHLNKLQTPLEEFFVARKKTRPIMVSNVRNPVRRNAMFADLHSRYGVQLTATHFSGL